MNQSAGLPAEPHHQVYKATAEVEHRSTVDEKSSDSDGSEISWTEAEEKAVRNKIDWMIVPLITFLYLLCFLE